MPKNLSLRRVLFPSKKNGQVVHALRGISMSVPRGKIVGILGKNGAGKSTLLRVLGGVYAPTRGRVETNGQVAGLFEFGGMGNRHLSGREYVRRYLRIMGIKEKKIPELIEDVWKFSELEEAFDHRIRTYSSGMTARLFFSTVTALQHEIYLIDELLSVGDEHFQAKCWQRMRQRLAGGASGVLVTHDWTAVLKLCEQAHVVEKGQFVFSGASDRAVVSYIKTPVLQATAASFAPANAHNYIVHSGKEVRLSFQVDILETKPVDLGFSIEMLRLGIGWEIILLVNRIQVGEKKGRYTVNILIPRFPLTAGTYSLNVFLLQRKLCPEGKVIVFDRRTWTTGNGLHLQVEGDAVNKSIQVPFRVRKLAESV